MRVQFISQKERNQWENHLQTTGIDPNDIAPNLSRNNSKNIEEAVQALSTTELQTPATFTAAIATLTDHTWHLKEKRSWSQQLDLSLKYLEYSNDSILEILQNAESYFNQHRGAVLKNAQISLNELKGLTQSIKTYSRDDFDHNKMLEQLDNTVSINTPISNDNQAQAYMLQVADYLSTTSPPLLGQDERRAFEHNFISAIESTAARGIKNPISIEPTESSTISKISGLVDKYPAFSVPK
jgi:hypothetical protein